MIQSFYDAVENVLDYHESVGTIEGLLSGRSAFEKAPMVFNREFVRSFPLAFTYFLLRNAENGNWHDRYEQDRWVTLPEVYALTEEDVVKLNFQSKGRLFMPTDTYTLSRVFKGNHYPFSAGPIFGLGYALEEMEYTPENGLRIKRKATWQFEKEHQWEGEPVIELSVDIHQGSHFWNDGERKETVHDTFLGITELKFSKKFLHEQGSQERNAEELFYQTLKREYKEYLFGLVDIENKIQQDLTGKLERIED